MERSRKNVLVLSICQALLFASNATLIAIAGLTGRSLAADKSLATLPLTASVVGAAVMTIPASLLMKRIGRRAGFTVGAVLGLLAVVMGSIALQGGSFWLFCAAMLMFGTYGAFAQYYRFAAADVAPPDFKSTAISLVLAGGLVGGLIGPEISKLTADLFAARFLGTFVALAVYAVLVIVMLRALRVPPPAEEQQQAEPRPLAVITAQPEFIVAVVGAALGFGVMNFLMVATPLAMENHGHDYAAAAFVIQWHVVAMFAPSFVTGWLIKRFGVLDVMFAGVTALAVCIAIALTDIGVPYFWFALVFLGIGWNFYIGGTTLLTETYRPTERAKTQGGERLHRLLDAGGDVACFGMDARVRRMENGQLSRGSAGCRGRPRHLVVDVAAVARGIRNNFASAIAPRFVGRPTSHENVVLLAADAALAKLRENRAAR